MFAKLIENPALSHKEQQEVLKTVLAQNIKQNIHEVRLQFNHNYPQLKNILLKHPKKALRLALALHTWQISLENINNKIQNNAVDLFLAVVREGPASCGQYLLTDLFKSFTDCWRMLVILKVVSQQVAQHLSVSAYGWMIAYFVMISASTLQNYLKLKNQPAQSNSDRAENDLMLIKHTEQWITNAYLKVIQGLKQPTSEQDRHVVLAAFSQICGALMENEGGGQLQVDKLLEIQKSAFGYLTRVFSLREVGSMFLRQLRDQNYMLRLQKIQIPSKYTPTSLYAKEGVCWLIQQQLRQAGDIYSDEQQLHWLLLAFSQSLESHLPLKEDFLSQIKNKFSKNISANNFELGYPLGVLLFNVYLYKREEVAYFSEQLGFGKDHTADLRRWKRLLGIHFDKLNIDKTALIVSQITSRHLAERQILSLLKSLKFDFTGKELCESVSKMIASAIEAHPEAKKVVTWVISREKDNERNVQFCNELVKTHGL